MSKSSIKQRVKLPATAETVFKALVDSRRHTAFTSAPAFMSRQEGRPFTAFNGMISGRNIEVKNNKRLVQAWRAKEWPTGVYSVVTIELKSAGRGACTLELTHTGLPANQVEKLKKGWTKHYWEPLKEYLKRSAARSTPRTRKPATRATTGTGRRARLKRAA